MPLAERPSTGTAGLSRRGFVRQAARRSVAAVLGSSVARAFWPCPLRADETKPLRVRSKEVFVKAPRPGVTARANSYYTRGEGLDKVCSMSTSTRSDTADTCERRFSTDNGRTWSDREPICFITKTEEGVHRQYPKPGWVDPETGGLLVMVLEGVLPSDNPLEGTKRWTLRYRVSTDGGHSYAVDERVVQRGDYTRDHPIEGVWVGKNSVMTGAGSCRPIRTRNGRILVPVQITPLGPDGEYHNPGGGYTYHEAAVLIGTWTDGLKIEWDLSARVANDPARSTRGCVEPTVAEMPDGRILMVMRGSNDVKPHLPGYKWYSVSDDGGLHFTPPEPWTYSDGSPFFSPSSCSQLLRHSNGRYYWIGNVSPSNPRGNSPRYPLVIGQVAPESLMLIKETVTVIDDRGADEEVDLQLSNFLAHEDRETGEVVLHMTRFFHRKGWRGDAYVYRIEL